MRKRIINILCAVLVLTVAITFMPTPSFATTAKLATPKVSTSVTSSTVTISWNKVSGAKKYYVYRATSPSGKYKKIKTTKYRSYKNSKLTTGKMYFYKVRAKGKVKRKTAYSSYVKVAATPLATPVCKSSSLISMNKVRTNTVKGATGYAVYRSTSASSGYSYIGSTRTLAFDDTTAVTGTVYYYKMRAYKSGSGYTTYSSYSSAGRGTRLLGVPETTVEMIADPEDETKNVMQISWTPVEAAAGYQVWRSSNEGSTYEKIYTGSELSYIDKTCEDGKTYYYKVRGYHTVYGVTDYGYASPSKHSRDKLIAQAESWLGYNEKSGKHKQIIDVYNNYKPLPRDVKGGYNEAWCTTYVTACGIKSGNVDIMPRERICRYMIDLYKELGLWVENDAYVPKPGDLIMYDWEDSGKGDCTGAPNHIGIVTAVSGNKITVIEGNKKSSSSDTVAYRTVTVNDEYIRGYATPRFDVDNGITFVLNRVVEQPNLQQEGSPELEQIDLEQQLEEQPESVEQQETVEPVE